MEIHQDPHNLDVVKVTKAERHGFRRFTHSFDKLLVSLFTPWGFPPVVNKASTFLQH